MGKTFPNLLIDLNINIQEAQQTQGRMNSKRFTQGYIKSNLKYKDKDNFESSKKIFNKIINSFLIRNSEGQKAVG